MYKRSLKLPVVSHLTLQPKNKRALSVLQTTQQHKSIDYAYNYKVSPCMEKKKVWLKTSLMI